MEVLSNIRKFAETAPDGEIALVSVSQDDAKFLVEIGNQEESQRNVRQMKVKKLQRAMQNGVWAPASPIRITRTKGTKKLFLADGQHRALAHINVDRDIVYLASLKECSNDNDVMTYFAELDIDQTPRSKQDRINASIGKLNGASGMAKPLVTSVWTALEILRAKTDDDLLATPSNYIDAWNDIGDDILVFTDTLNSKANPKMICGFFKQPVMIAASLFLIRTHGDAAIDFISGALNPPEGDTWMMEFNNWATAAAVPKRGEEKRTYSGSVGRDLVVPVKTAYPLVLFACFNRHVADKPIPRQPIRWQHLIKKGSDGIVEGWEHEFPLSLRREIEAS